jgi:hypothetical protein
LPSLQNCTYHEGRFKVTLSLVPFTALQEARKIEGLRKDP